MSNFIKFVTEVSTHTKAMAALIKDPEKAMSDAGLTEEEKEVMRTRDKGKLNEYIANHYNDQEQPLIWNIWWVS